MPKFWVVGPIVWDQVLHVSTLFRGGYTLATSVEHRPGGTGANIAMALASTSASVRMVGWVGADENGAKLVRTMHEVGVNTTYVEERDAPTLRVVVIVETDGESTVVGIPPDLIHTVRIPIHDIEAQDIVYFTVWRKEFYAKIKELAAKQVTVITAPPDISIASLPARYIIGSEAEYRNQIVDDSVVAESQFIEAVLITRGSEGVTVHTSTGSRQFSAIRSRSVDTTGAGDAFASGFVWQVANGSPIETAVQQGILWATAAVKIESSVPPPWTTVFLSADVG
jgi:sugar/nucleoside kinase (ribokinase family)